MNKNGVHLSQFFNLKILRCAVVSASILLPSISDTVWAASGASSRDQLIHVTGLLLTTPGNKQVAESVRQKTKIMMNDRSLDLKSHESREALRISAKALSVHQIRDLFDRCLSQNARAKGLGQRILNSASSSELQSEPCKIFNDPTQLKELTKLDRELALHMENKVAELAVTQSQKNFARTYTYWDRRIDEGKLSQSLSDVCDKIKCSEDEKNNLTKTEAEFLSQWPKKDRNKKLQDVAQLLNEKAKIDPEKRNLKSQDELLLFTKALKDKKHITESDVIKAKNEVKGLLEDQMKEVRNMKLAELVKTNPAALGQVLLDNPELTVVVCNIINQIADSEENAATWNKVYMWGGLIVGGALLVTGIGAGVGAMVLSGTAMAGTLVTVATASAVAGTAIGVGDTIYSSSKSLDASHEALSLRASLISQNGDRETAKESDAMMEEAWSELTSAGIGAASIIPFGAIWKVMGKTAQVSKVGSLTKMEKMAAKEKSEAIKDLSQTIRELKDPQMEKVLINAKAQVSEEDYGSFIGQLSQLTPEQRLLVMSKMKGQPEKVSEAIKRGAQKGKEICE
jgi:hypothetical protein